MVWMTSERRGMTSDTLPQDDGSEAIDRAANIIAQSLAQALMEAEVILDADRRARTPAISPQVIEAIERFGDVITRLVEHTEVLATRVATLTETVAQMAEAREQQPSRPQLPELEPSFAPGGEGIDVTIAAVPGFQGLMELQRALVRLPQVQSAAVRRYQDDEAAIQLVLSQPMTASAIAEGVSGSTGKQMLVDESRPDGLRLRLRFLDGR
jgi:hypothetical protein